MTDLSNLLQITYDAHRKQHLMKVPPVICSNLSLSGEREGLLLSHTDRNELVKLKKALVSAVAADEQSRRKSSSARRWGMIMALTGVIFSSLLIVFEKDITGANEAFGWFLRIGVSALMCYCLYTIFVSYHHLGSGRDLDELSRELEKVRLQEEIRQRFS